MTERKPPAVTFESWVDRQIREATERGAFDNLAGAGKPLRDDTAPYDENWWLKDKLRREGLSVLPGTLAVRKEAEDAYAAALAAPTDSAARLIIARINERITGALHTPMDGPPLGLRPFDVEAVLRERGAA